MPLLELISQLQRLATGAGLNAEALPAETHFHGLPRLISELGIRFRSFGGNTRSTLFLVRYSLYYGLKMIVLQIVWNIYLICFVFT